MQKLNQNAQVHASEKLISIDSLSSNYLQGSKTGCIYSTQASILDYNDEYFLGEYEAQYGSTYLDDEPKIRELAKNRLNLITKYIKPKANLLELGCATGFFLDEARSLGFSVKGCEISNFASNYAKNKFQLDIFQGPILKYPTASFDIIVASFVLEHIAQQHTLFMKLAKMLKPGGILMFALPSSFGPMLEFHPQKWEQTHPVDHFIDYNPTSIRKTLQFYDIKLLECRPASFHQDRCQGWKRWIPKFAYKRYANTYCYGDTFEGIAQKL